MSTIFLTNNIKTFQHLIKQCPDFVIINIPFKCQKKRTECHNRIIDLKIEDIEKKEFDKKFKDFIASLGEQYHSKYWWAQSLAEKNEFLSRFYPRLFYTIHIFRYINSCDHKGIIIFTDDQDVIFQLKSILKRNHLLRTYSNPFYQYYKKARNCLRISCKIFLAFLTELNKIIQSQKYMSGRINEIKESNPWYVIRTIIDGRSYKQGKYVDSFFHDLPFFLMNKGVNVLIYGEVVSDYKNNLRKIASQRDINIVTPEVFWSLKDLRQVIGESLMKRFCLPSPICFDGVNVDYILRAEIDECFFSIKFLKNLIAYSKMKSLIKNVRIQTYLTTFENHAWEKLNILALREAKNEIKILGYQHAFVTENSFKFLLGEGEEQFAPLPDCIITTGEVTRDILRTYGVYKNVKMDIGCSLRQLDSLVRRKIITSADHKNILIPLSIDPKDAIKVLHFIYEAGLGDSLYKVFLRFHPLTSVKDVLSGLTFSWPKNFQISKDVSLQDDFKRSGVVLYTWTTVCLEALLGGVPVIYLDVNYPYILDPLFEFVSDLKTTVAMPQELLKKIEEMFNLDDHIFEREYKRVQEYLRHYFHPAEEENLQVFINERKTALL